MTFNHKNSKTSTSDIIKYRQQLLQWYDEHRRDIPWRVKPGQTATPYHIWLSEIMCQQTTVQAVKPYYLKFLELWPRVQDLAAAEQGEVMAAWAGLGYYARARNLHKCAQIIANERGGVFPETQGALRALPGIGDYTSAAITAIAYNRPATVVDGNVERVMARFFAVEEALPASKKKLKALAHDFYEGFAERPGDLAQAFMDLGAGVCISKAPRCALCPLQENCQGYKKDIAASLPKKKTKTFRPRKHGNVYWIINKKGEVLFHQREERGLLGGMPGLPTSGWGEGLGSEHPVFAKRPKSRNIFIDHTFTHFDLRLYLYEAQARDAGDFNAYDLFWAFSDSMEEKLPSLFKKAYKAFCA